MDYGFVRQETGRPPIMGMSLDSGFFLLANFPQVRQTENPHEQQKEIQNGDAVINHLFVARRYNQFARKRQKHEKENSKVEKKCMAHQTRKRPVPFAHVVLPDNIQRQCEPHKFDGLSLRKNDMLPCLAVAPFSSALEHDGLNQKLVLRPSLPERGKFAGLQFVINHLLLALGF